jgi:hypothetical protein
MLMENTFCPKGRSSASHWKVDSLKYRPLKLLPPILHLSFCQDAKFLPTTVICTRPIVSPKAGHTLTTEIGSTYKKLRADSKAAPLILQVTNETPADDAGGAVQRSKVVDTQSHGFDASRPPKRANVPF